MNPSISASSTVLFCTLLSACGGQATETTTVPAFERVTAVAAVELEEQDFSLALRVTGVDAPLREFRVAARMAGILREVRYEEGQHVSSGTVLARFDLAEQQAELSRARTVAAHAATQYRRASESAPD